MPLVTAQVPITALRVNSSSSPAQSAVEAALELLPATPAKVLDLGTGSGAIALALASERPAWQVTAVDRVLEAVALAERNRQRLHLKNATVLNSHWFSALQGHTYDLIISNPPYIAANDPHLVAGDVRFEPASALVAVVSHDLRNPMTIISMLCGMMQIAIVAAGVGAILAASSTAFYAIKWFGVAYLIYLAVKSWVTTCLS